MPLHIRLSWLRWLCLKLTGLAVGEAVERIPAIHNHKVVGEAGLWCLDFLEADNIALEDVEHGLAESDIKTRCIGLPGNRDAAAHLQCPLTVPGRILERVANAID